MPKPRPPQTPEEIAEVEAALPKYAPLVVGGAALIGAGVLLIVVAIVTLALLPQNGVDPVLALAIAAVVLAWGILCITAGGAAFALRDVARNSWMG